MKSKSIVVVVVMVLSSPLMALIQYNDGGTYDITTTIHDDVRVDYQAPGMETTLNLHPGGIIVNNFYTYEDSRINLSGGAVGRSLMVYGSSHINFSSGSITEALMVYDTSQVVISGGWMRNLNVYDNSNVIFSDSIIGKYDLASAGGQVTVLSGTINGSLRAGNGSQIDLYGGSIGGNLEAYEGSVLTIHGSGFTFGGEPVGYGKLVGFPAAILTGTLTNGEQINNLVAWRTDGSIILIPEPATLFLLGLGAVMVTKKR